MAQAALKADEHDGPARLLSGMAYMMSDAPTQAEQDFARYVVRNPRDASVQRVLTDLRAELSHRGREFKALGSQHADELRKASVQALLGDAELRVWQYSKAAEWFERVAASQPPDPLAAVKQAVRRFSREQLDLAAADLERVVALNDGIKPANSALVLAHLARSDTAKAMDAVAAMEKKSPASSSVGALAGYVLVERNQRGEAERRFEEALQADPKSVSAVVGRARMDIAAGKLDLARKRFDDALKADPENLQALIFYAYLEDSARRRGEAHVLLERAIKAHPNAVEPKVVLIGFLRKENDKERATAVAEKMLQAHPDDPIAIEVAADVQLWNGDADRGVATLRRLLKLLPRSPESYFVLANAQLKAGLKAEGQANLQRALELPLDESDAQALPVFGIIDRSKTLEAIELARKSIKRPPSAASTMQADRGSWGGEIGGSRFYDALSGSGAPRKGN
jgi:tetratricopeptide (TPR) repeat protein